MKAPVSILLVDNLDDGLKSLKKSLLRKYETVVMAHNETEALSVYGQNRFDIVIVALEMYGQEGYDIITAINAINPGQRILTYSAEPEKPSSHVSCEECMRTNLRHRIRKPVQLEDLYREIENFDTLSCREAKLKEGSA